jgi:UDP-glucose:(heptosyl)LPS alpha-1,3-glucosyltransferase
VLLLIVGGSDDIIAEANASAQELGVGDRVLFVGPRHDLAPFLAASDMFVLPSAYEANALVVLEALASGLPVVTTRVGYAPEIVVDGDNGYLVDRDPRAVGERLEELAGLEDDELAGFRLRARASVEGHSWRATAERYLALAEELLAERPAAGGRGAPGGAEARAAG